LKTLRWFFLSQKNEVLGPLEKWEIELHLVSEPEGLVWGSGATDWLAADEWRKRVRLLEEVLSDLESDKQEIWYYQDKSKVLGPFDYHNLIQELKKCVDSSQISIRRAPNKKMRSINEWPILVEEIGLSRRRHNRVPIQAQFQSDKTFKKKLNTISEGGFSLLECSEFNLGDRLTGHILSSFFDSPLQCSAKLIHQHSNEISSFQFESINSQDLRLIQKYTAQFEKKK